MVKMRRGYSPEETSRKSIRSFGSVLVFLFAVISLISFCNKAFAANGTTAGTVTALATSDTSIKVAIPYSEDADANNTVRVQWKFCSDTDYAAPPTNTTDVSHASSPYGVTISGLTANTCYQIKTIYNDSAVSGSNPQTIKIATTWDNTLLHNSNRFAGTNKWNGGSGNGNWGTGAMANSGATAPSKYGQITCETCHISDAPNIKRVRSSIASPNGTDSFPGQTGGSTINFQSVTTPNGFADDTGGHATSQKICEYCHTLNKYHNYNTANNTGGFLHNNNTDCTGCHPHSLGFFYNASCDSCHGNPPTLVSIGGPNGLASPATQALGPSPTDPGAHNAHAVARAMMCEACHNGYSMPGNTIQLNFQVAAGTFPGWGTNPVSTATYNAPQASLLLNSYSFVGSGNTTVVTSGTYTNQCSNLYCHGGGDAGALKAALSGGSNQTPSWAGGPSQAACGTCHAASVTNPPTMGAHQRHAATGIYAGSKQGLGLACTKCHSTTTDMTHVNGKVAWGLDRADTKFGGGAVYNNAQSGELDNLAPSSTYQSCNNIYCHSSVQNDGGTAAGSYVTQVWQSGAVGCDSCHGQGGHSNGQPATGSHESHVTSKSIACTACHNGGGAETTSHANKVIDMSIDATYGGTYTQGSHAPQSGGYGSCSTVSCHGTSAPAWGNTSTGCNFCHPYSAGEWAGYTPIAVEGNGAHAKHIAHLVALSSALNPATDQFGNGASWTNVCGVCHNGATHMSGTSRTIAIPASYQLGTNAPVYNAWDHINTSSSVNPKTCSNISCHFTITPVWSAY